MEGSVKEWLAAPNGVVHKTLESMGTKIQAEFKVSQTSGVSTAEKAADLVVEKHNKLDTKEIDALDISAIIMDIDRVPKFGKLSWDDRFFLEIHATNNEESHNIMSQGQQGVKCLMWDTTFAFNVSQTSRLVYRVLGYDGKESESIPIAIAIFEVDELLQQNSLIRRPFLSSAAFVHPSATPLYHQPISFPGAANPYAPLTPHKGYFHRHHVPVLATSSAFSSLPRAPSISQKRIAEHLCYCDVKQAKIGSCGMKNDPLFTPVLDQLGQPNGTFVCSRDGMALNPRCLKTLSRLQLSLQHPQNQNTVLHPKPHPHRGKLDSTLVLSIRFSMS